MLITFYLSPPPLLFFSFLRRMLGRIYTDSGIWAGMALEQRQDAASTTSEMISPFLPYLRTTFDMLRLLLTFVLMIPLYNRFTSSSSSLFQLAGGRAVWIVLEGKVPPPDQAVLLL